MKMKSFVLLIVLLISFCNVGYVRAWDTLHLSHSETIQTDEGPKTIFGRVTMAFGDVLDLFVDYFGGDSKTKSCWELGACLGAGYGTYYLIANFIDALDDCESEAQIYEGFENTWVGRCETCSLAFVRYAGWNFTLTSSQSLPQRFIMEYSEQYGHGFVSITPTDYSTFDEGVECPMVEYRSMAADSLNTMQTIIAAPGYTVDVVVISGDPYIYMEQQELDEEAIEAWLAAHGDIKDTVILNIEDDPPAGDPGEDYYDEGTCNDWNVQSGPEYDDVEETYNDPYTDGDVTPVTDPDEGTYTPPNYPDVPQQGEGMAYDTGFDIVEEEDLSELLGTWLDNAPYMAFFDDISVSGSGSQSSFDIQTPFGTTGHIDFSQYESLYATIASIIIAFAYIYAIYIFFIGG